jgi:ABC-type polysaccharide/polyol phosphate export permease
MHSLVQLTLVRFREFVREPEALFWALIFPVLLTTGLGVAFRNQPADVLRVGAVTPTLVSALRTEKLLDVADLSVDAATAALRTGKIVLVAEPGAAGNVTYRYDDTNPQGRAARTLADHAVQVAAGRVDPVAATDTLLREPGSRYVDFLVPGLVAIGIMSNAVWGLGFSIVDARRRKLMKRIMATPMPRSHFLLSFLVWRLLLLVIEVGVPIGFGVLVFGVPVRGSLGVLVLISVLGSLAFSSMGLLIASRARTIEAVSGLMNVVLLPMWILCGVFFSSERFPDTVQPFIKLLPLTACIDALRANLLQGSGLVALSRELAILSGWTVVCFGSAMRLFRWK